MSPIPKSSAITKTTFGRSAAKESAVQKPAEATQNTISLFDNREPTFAIMRDAKRDFLGDRYAVMVFPPQKNYIEQVGANQNVLHLWATDDEWPLPEFGKTGTI